jgi:uncharacterized membrane protein YcjF (UPF0283 family)
MLPKTCSFHLLQPCRNLDAANGNVFAIAICKRDFRHFRKNHTFKSQKTPNMDNLQHEQYEYARNRIRQKKNVFRHFILLIVGGLFLYVINKCLNVDQADDWYAWGITLWAFFFVLHFMKVFITDSFMNKNWERHQIDKLVSMQQKKMQKLQAELDADKDDAQNLNR